MKKLKNITAIIVVIVLILSYNLPIFAAIEENVEQDTIQTQSNDSKIINLSTLPSVDNMSMVGTNRGNNHDKQNLGIYMPAGSSFKIRQTNLNLGTDLTLKCLNNNSATEKTIQIPKNGDWVEVKVENDSVPFIATLYKKTEKPQVEISELTGTEDLTYYYYKGNEQEFFKKWNTNNHSYAVIENERVTFLVPLKDREKIVIKNPNIYQFGSIDEMLEYYEDFIEQYDKFLGLSYNSKNTLNNNVKTKFFVKANINGAGAAYYGGDHTAQNGDSISGYLTRNWLDLHELGHGYEGSLANQDLSLIDVMNNILGYYYQKKFIPENDGGWMGKKINVEEGAKQAREAATKFNDIGSYQYRLYMFVNLLDKIGPEQGMAYVHSKYREYVSNGKKLNASDMFSKGFSEYSGYNVIPYLNSFKIYPSEDISSEIYEQELPMIYYLRELVNSNERAEQIRKDLNLSGNYDLVSNSDIAKYNMTGNLNININIDDLQQLKNKKIYIKDGKKIIKEIEITSNNIDIKDLPVGIYTLQMPNTKSGTYEYDYKYIIIKENEDTKSESTYTKVNSSKLASDTKIRFKGLGDSEFGNLTIDLENKNIHIVSYNIKPHVYFTDEYMNVKILDSDNKTIYEKQYIGNQSSPSDDNIKFELGYKIVLKHREAQSRLVFESSLLNEKEQFSNLNNEPTTYVITEYGLQKEGITDEEQYQIHKEKIDKFIKKLSSEIIEEKKLNKNAFFKQKSQLLESIQTLRKEDREQYIEQNKTLLNGSAPTIKGKEKLEFKVGDKFTINSDEYVIEDIEDGKINFVSSNIELYTNAQMENNIFMNAGEYKLEIKATDTDGNIGIKNVAISVASKQEESKDDNNQGNNNDKDNNSNKNDDSNKDNNSDKEDNSNKNENNDTNPNTPSDKNNTVDEKENDNNSNLNDNNNITNIEENNNQNAASNEEISNNIENKNSKDETTSKTKLPKAGKASIIAIFLSLAVILFVIIKKAS